MAFRRKKPSTDLVAVDVAISKGLEAAKAAIAQEELSKGFLNGNAAVTPGSSWSNTGNSRLIARVSRNLESSFGRATPEMEAAMAEQGLSWGPPFPPGRPLDPFWGVNRPARTWDFAVGENTQLVPRWNRISFGTLKALYESYDVAQVCVRHLINDVRSLDYQFIPPANIAEDATADIEKAEDFFSAPDRRQPFRAWVAEYLQDVLRYDAGCLYVRKNEAGDPYALEVVSGSTMIPLIDFFGRLPMDGDEVDIEKLARDHGGVFESDVVPAYLQIIEGMPWLWLAADEIMYQPLNPLPDSQYGLAPLEAVLLTANTDIRFQWHFLQYFTEGTIPAGFMEAPPDLSDPAQVREWQDTWDALMMGDQAKLRQVRWVPNGSKFTPLKNEAFDSAFPLYLMRRVTAAFGVTPNDLGFTEDVNRSTGDTQIDVQFRVGTLPLIRHVEDIINLFIREHLHLKARIHFDTGREVEDRLTTAQSDAIYIEKGVLSPDEVRVKLGKRISKERAIPRYIDNSRAGPIPLIGLTSVGGDIDPATYAPSKRQELIDHPYVSIPGVAPVIGSNSHQQAQNATEAMQQNMILENDAPNAPHHVMLSDGSVTSTPVSPLPVQGEGQGSAEKGLSAEACAIINHLLDRLEKDETGGPGVTRGFSNALTVETGVQGSDLIGDDEDEDAEKVLKQWRQNARNRVKKGQTPRRFDDVPDPMGSAIWGMLEHAGTPEEVDAAFAFAGKVSARLQRA